MGRSKDVSVDSDVEVASDRKTAVASDRPKVDEAGAPAEERPAAGMGGFAKGLSVIEAFSASNDALTVADIARLTGLDRATARRCVLTLVNTGYAAANGRLFTLTPRVLRLSAAYLNASLPRLLQPSLENLAERIHESCSASILDGNEILYIARATQHRVMSIGLNVGSRLPAYCSSMGRVLLASLSIPEARKRLETTDRSALTSKTLTDIDELMAELDKVRATGYAINDQELEEGLRSLAVPVFNMSGKVVAALNVGTQAARCTTKQLKTEILPEVLQEQARLREQLP